MEIAVALVLVSALSLVAGYLLGIVHACWVLGRSKASEPQQFQIIRLVDRKEMEAPGKPEKRQDN